MPISQLAQPGSPRPQASALPFVVRPIASEAELRAVIALRASAYRRTAPQLGELLAHPEPDDRQDGNVVLAAFDKASGGVLATLRIHTSSTRGLPLEASVALPAALAGRPRAEVTRLARRPDAQPIVKLALFKAFYRFCVRQQLELMFAAGREPLYRQYQALLFDEVFPGAGLVPLRHAGGLPHKVLFLDLASAEARWRRVGHPLLSWIVELEHPDIAP
jgi:hypothetical protein